MDAYLTQGQARRMAATDSDPWREPVAAAVTAPDIAASAPIGQLHLSDIAAMEAAGDGAAALLLRASVLHESADGSPIRGAILTLDAPGVWFDSDPFWHQLDRGAEEGWSLAVDAGAGRATFTFAGILGHGGSTGITARLGIEPGTRIAGREIVLTAAVHGTGADHAPTVQRVTVA
ncbi:hypothetical protein QQX10_08465 [Demequina sp. SYSU T00039]|uniref:Uncharacterized protein n=1 Tax=Demequina lignilytica TaxID=3051663 RepID=A0AAW7M5G8_9MICO|nr:MULTISPECIES: hypothetical protein [unclassified Demequina]MDN4477451.1 hypothetical protein [Demequina sp. SYSU T00039-1]MDN4488198.1 hypothetical protein [Demequina sp. SYSU T00039]